FALILLKKDEGRKSWLLVKKRDKYSTYKRSETPPDISVKTGRTMEEIVEQADDVWLPKRTKRDKPAAAVPMPRKNKPMTATPGRKGGETGWILDPRIGRIRALAEVEGKR